jgi:hypothetical protein
MTRALGWAFLVVMIGGCVSAGDGFERGAAASALERSAVRGAGFWHAIYRKPGPGNRDATPVHVYLTGDGRPYNRAGLAAADPTPRRPVVVRLARLDPAPAMILGRPC